MENVDNILKRIVKSSIFVFFILIVSKILGYAYRIIIARYYGAEIYGLVTLALIVISLAVTLAPFGIIDGLIHFIPKFIGEKNPKKVKYIIQKSIKILFISSVVSAVLIFLFSDLIAVKIFGNESLIIFIKLLSLMIPLWILSNIFTTVLASLEKIEWSSFLTNIVFNAVHLIGLIALIFIVGKNESAIIFSYILAYAVLCIFSFIIYKKYTKIYFTENLEENLKKEETKGTFRKLFAFSWPLVFSGIIIKIFFWIDSVTIGYFLDVTSVGWYNAAVPIAMLFAFAPEVFTKLFFPLANKEYSQHNNQVTKEISKQVGKWIILINFPLLIIILSFPEQIITLLFGAEYLVAKTSLIMLSIGSFIFAQANVSRKLILISGKSKILLKNILITSLLGLLLNIFLVQRMGINGAALATLIVQVVLSAMLIIESKHITHIVPIKRKVLRIMLISLALVFGLNLLKTFINLNFISAMILGIFVVVLYVLLIVFCKCLDKNDIMILKAIRNKF